MTELTEVKKIDENPIELKQVLETACGHIIHKLETGIRDIKVIRHEVIGFPNNLPEEEISAAEIKELTPPEDKEIDDDESYKQEKQEEETRMVDWVNKQLYG